MYKGLGRRRLQWLLFEGFCGSSLKFSAAVSINGDDGGARGTASIEGVVVVVVVVVDDCHC